MTQHLFIVRHMQTVVKLFHELHRRIVFYSSQLTLDQELIYSFFFLFINQQNLIVSVFTFCLHTLKGPSFESSLFFFYVSLLIQNKNRKLKIEYARSLLLIGVEDCFFFLFFLRSFSLFHSIGSVFPPRVIEHLLFRLKMRLHLHTFISGLCD